MNVNIVNLNHQGRDKMIEVVDMFSLDIGPLKFNLIEKSSDSNYFKLHKSLDRITVENLNELSNLIREHHSISKDDYVAVVSQKPLESPNSSDIYAFKDWYSMYNQQNIMVKSGGWNEITEGKPHLGIAHQIIENLFQSLGKIDLYSITLSNSIHIESKTCINDFCEKPNETKGKIRSGYICQSCIQSALSVTKIEYIIQIKNILKRISDQIRDNYTFEFSPEQLQITVNSDYSIDIGGHRIEFGKRGRVYHIAYLFFLINNKIGISKKDLALTEEERKKKQEGRIARVRFISLFNHIYKKIYENEVDSYLNNVTSIHSRISKRIKKQLSIEELAIKYGFSSKRKSGNTFVYFIDVAEENLTFPNELYQFRID